MGTPVAGGGGIASGFQDLARDRVEAARAYPEQAAAHGERQGDAVQRS
jgi:hypothetical protein